jgi:hypothetical protein
MSQKTMSLRLAVADRPERTETIRIPRGDWAEASRLVRDYCRRHAVDVTTWRGGFLKADGLCIGWAAYTGYVFAGDPEARVPVYRPEMEPTHARGS